VAKVRGFLTNSVYFGVIISLAGYIFGVKIKNKFRSSLFNPLLISIIFVMAVLVLFHVDYESYNNGAKILSYLLTPATVCLAIPLYQQLELLKKNIKAVFFGIFAGMLSSLLSVLALAYLFRLSHAQYVTLLPKSITTAIGLGISEELGGITTITVAVIIITGVLGNIIAELICKIFRIHHPIAVGLALGTSAHAIGTAKALEIGEIEGAMSSLSIAVCGLLTVIGASVFANFL
jgi:predicted murein hydrolase (TIGR00659 family)